MKDFLKNALEPLSYLIYALSIFIIPGKNKRGKKVVLFFYYLLASILIGIACYTPSNEVNRIIYNTFFFITISFFSYYFKCLLKGKWRIKTLAFLYGIHVIIFIKITLISHQLLLMNNYVYAFTYLSIVIYILLYFVQVLNNVSELNLLHQFDFWLVSGYLLYFLSCFFIILFYENIDINQRALAWSIQNFILFISSIFTLSGSIWINSQKKYY